MTQDIEMLKARVNEAKIILDLVAQSIESLNIILAPKEEGVKSCFLTMEEAYKYLKMSRSKFYDFRNEVYVPSYPVLGKTYYKKDDLDKAMESFRL
ncbi:MAG: helix-turn-helix domain-containing protein, partial [Spirochaetales bacterium]|nr:helix-turn-helix domain-containing protein [Spirochaetales bacterium]